MCVFTLKTTNRPVIDHEAPHRVGVCESLTQAAFAAIYSRHGSALSQDLRGPPEALAGLLLDRASDAIDVGKEIADRSTQFFPEDHSGRVVGDATHRGHELIWFG